MVNLKFVPLHYEKEEEVLELLEFVKDKNFKMLFEPSWVKNHTPKIIVVNTIERTLSLTNITCMACWSNLGYKPITISMFIGGYEHLVDKQNVDYYILLLEQRRRDLCN